MSDMYRSRSRNCILLRDDVGRAKASAYDLPHESFAFGRAEQPDMEGAGDVTMNWAAHVPNPKQGPDQRDFMRINKKAAASRVTNPRDLKEFTKMNDIKVPPTGPSGVLPKIIPSDVIPSFAYGVKARPSTPMQQVISGDFEAAENARLDSVYRQRDEALDARQKKHKVQLTKSAKAQIENARALKMSEASQESAPVPYKMNKYKNVSSKLNLAPLGKSASTPGL